MNQMKIDIKVGDTVEAHYEGRPDGKVAGQVVKLTEQEMVIRTGWTTDTFGNLSVPVLAHVFGDADGGGHNAPGVVVKKLA